MRSRPASKVAAIACASAALVCTLLTAPSLATAQGRGAPTRLAQAMEQRAERTSFADLERFGEKASHGLDRESLARLQHVAWILLNQSEFDQFDHWNAILADHARRQGDERYVAMAQINALYARYEKGDVTVAPELKRRAQDETDWFARVHAMSAVATMLINEDQTGQALKTLLDAEQLIPANDPAANAAESTIWETIGLGLMVLDDLNGSAEAFQRADFQFADPTFPRPDFDGVYNMAHMAVMRGDPTLAREISAMHHRLALRSDLPHLKIWDQNLCAMTADAFGTPAEVLNCLKGLDDKLSGAEFLAQDLLPLRAIARARTGDVAGAQADLKAMQVLIDSHAFVTSNLERAGQVRAEILAAQGRNAEAVAGLRDYDKAHAAAAARRFNVGVHQLTGSLQTQLATARKDVDLQRQASRLQYWVIGIAGLFLICAAGVLLWQRRVGLRLRAAQLKAETASRSKSEFLANMSHEIRTPLNGVVGVADLLAASDLPKRERDMVEIIRSSGQSLERLLSDVLDLARVEAGRMTIEPAPFQAADLVRTVAALLDGRAREKGLTLTLDIDPALEGWFLGDAVRVRQILTNLVSNAVKFTDHGGVTLIASAPEPGRLNFDVIDTGVGFDAAAKARLFSRFQQADGSITRRFGGTGLGLAISRQLASLMDGELDCESEPARGSRFSFSAPFPPAAAPDAQEERTTPSEPTDERPIRVLVVDDHDTNRTVVRMMLDQFGVSTVTAANGLEAVGMVRREAFDLVFMDMQMPVMDGLEATRIIRDEERADNRPRIPVIMLSANAMPEHRQAARAAGADGHVSKPVTVTALITALNEALSPGEAAAENWAMAEPASLDV